MEKLSTRRQWERDCKELVRLGLLMSRVALDWTLSRRWREDLGAPPQTWEQFSREGRILDLYIVNSSEGEKATSSRRKTEMWGFQFRLDEIEKGQVEWKKMKFPVYDHSWKQGGNLGPCFHEMFTWYDNLWCLFLIVRNMVVTTLLLYICQVIGKKWGWSVTMLWNIRIGRVL